MTTTLPLISAHNVAARDPAAIDVIDVRTPGEFNRVHATPARLLPLDRLEVSGD